MDSKAADMTPLTYSDYINDRAIIDALRIPMPPPAGQSEASWPCWHPPGQAGPGIEWSPGDPWPRDGAWRHDEVLFIRTHQAFEVWFAQILHELDDVLHRAREICRTHGAALPRVELDSRKHEAPRTRANEFPAIHEEADRAQAPGLAEHVRRMGAPGRHFIESPLRADWFEESDLDLWSSRLHRATQALAVCIPFYGVLSTLTPAQFLAFRGRLVPASGFGSVQFRELEFAVGLRELNLEKIRPTHGTSAPDKSGRVIPEGMLRPTDDTPAGVAANCVYRTQPPDAWPRIAARFSGPSLRDLVYALINADGLFWRDESTARREIDAFAARNIRELVRDWGQSGGTMAPLVGAESLLTERMDDLDEVLSHRETISVALLISRRQTDPHRAAISRFLEACLRLDAELLHWRDTHIRFVEGIIGKRRGTGGGGIQYLQRTVDPSRGAFFTHGFPCLWYARSVVQAMNGE
jgi:tryptophan 2,3-dioxygenase